MNNSKTIFQQLKGNWVLERFKDDVQIAKAQAIFSCAAANPNILLYNEEGTAIVSAQEKFDFYRQYEYHLKQNTIDVYFVKSNNEKNKLFHTLDFKVIGNAFIANGEYKCSNDLYTVKYYFYSKKEFSITYKVSGPNKKYLLLSNLKKIS